jgi:hypothetical protein
MAVHSIRQSLLGFAFFCALSFFDNKTGGVQAKRFGSVPVVGEQRTVLDSRRRQGDYMTQGTREYFGNTCRVILADDGKFTTEKMIDGQYREAWSSGKSSFIDPDGQFLAVLRQDGVLEKKFVPNHRRPIVFYETVHQVDQDYALDDFFPSYYVLLIDEDCVLRIYGRVFSNDGSSNQNGDPREVWSNVRQAMTEGDIMLQGDIIRGEHNGTSTHMTLQHDCNLVQMYGSNYPYYVWSEMIWASGSDSINDPDDVECWVLVEDEHVRVCVGEFDVTNRHDCNAP